MFRFLCFSYYPIFFCGKAAVFADFRSRVFNLLYPISRCYAKIQTPPLPLPPEEGQGWWVRIRLGHWACSETGTGCKKCNQCQFWNERICFLMVVVSTSFLCSSAVRAMLHQTVPYDGRQRRPDRQGHCGAGLHAAGRSNDSLRRSLQAPSR